MSVLCAALLAACASSAQEKPPVSAQQVQAVASPHEDAGVTSDAELVALPVPDKTLRQELVGGDPAYLGVLDRKSLVAIIDQGLGRVLARLKLSPAMRDGRFEGFRVSEIDPAWSGTGLLVGDVLQRVNGQPIERPEQAQLAFDSLRVASEVSLELLRAGQKVALRYRIE
jgi:S1-C subfamily serine protease